MRANQPILPEEYARYEDARDLDEARLRARELDEAMLRSPAPSRSSRDQYSFEERMVPASPAFIQRMDQTPFPFQEKRPEPLL